MIYLEYIFSKEDITDKAHHHCGRLGFSNYLICYVKIWIHMLNAVLPQDLFCSEGFFSPFFKPQTLKDSTQFSAASALVVS